jgi:hypothetical protein
LEFEGGVGLTAEQNRLSLKIKELEQAIVEPVNFFMDPV